MIQRFLSPNWSPGASGGLDSSTRQELMELRQGVCRPSQEHCLVVENLGSGLPVRGYRFSLPLPLSDAARPPRLAAGSLFSFDRRWSSFLRPLSCFCFATGDPFSGGRTLAPSLG